MRARLLSLLLAATLCPVVALDAHAGSGSCGAEGASPKGSAGQQWRATQKLYYFDGKHRLVRSEFDGSARVVVSDHGFDSSGPDAYPSSDGRFVAYVGNLKSGQSAQLWVFDTVTGRDRLLLESPWYSIGIPMFSADGRKLAVDVQQRSKSQVTGVGLQLFDLPSGQKRFLGWPPRSRFKLGTDSHLFPAWSADGRLLVSMIGDGPGGKRTREFWEIDLASKKFLSIDGRFNNETYEDEFKISGRWITLAKEAFIPARRGGADQVSASGRYVARIDAKHRLEIQHGATRGIAALGSYNDCEGVTLQLNGWVDGDRYLVFSLDSRAYLHDPRTGKTTKLFKAGRDGKEFFWGPPHTGLAPN